MPVEQVAQWKVYAYGEAVPAEYEAQWQEIAVRDRSNFETVAVTTAVDGHLRSIDSKTPRDIRQPAQQGPCFAPAIVQDWNI